MNAIDIPTLDGLIEALETAENSADVRVIVLAGSGRSFCAGADIGQMIDRTPTDWRLIVDHYLDPIRVISRMGKPVIARCHGNVFGGGLGLAMACDFRVASDDARFCTPFVKLALAGCDMASGYFLPRLIGLGRSTDMMMTARVVEAAEALAIGLVTQVVPDDQLDAAVDELAGRLAAGAPNTTAFTKSAIRKSRSGHGSGIRLRNFCAGQCLLSEDHREGVAAFRENETQVSWALIPCPAKKFSFAMLLVRQEITPNATRWDMEERYPQTVSQARRSRLAVRRFQKKSVAMAADPALCPLCAELARGSAAIALGLYVHSALACAAIFHLGDEDQNCASAGCVGGRESVVGATRKRERVDISCRNTRGEEG